MENENLMSIPTILIALVCSFQFVIVLYDVCCESSSRNLSHLFHEYFLIYNNDNNRNNNMHQSNPEVPLSLTLGINIL